MKTASQSVNKWANRAGASVNDYEAGARSTSKDQAAAAIAAKGNYAAGLQQSLAKGSYEKGLSRSGKSGWLNGVVQKGVTNFGTGVSAATSAEKYASNSGKYDSARNAAASVARGPKGSPQNLQRVAAVANALRAAKVGA